MMKFSEDWRRLLFALTLIIGIFPRANAAQLQFDVFLGYDGTVVPNKWFPISFELFNPGPSFDGIIEISSGHFAGKTRVGVELPTGTRKRVQVPMYVSGGYVSWDVRLLDVSGKIRDEKKDIKPKLQLYQDAHLLGGLARSQPGIPNFPTIKTSVSAAQPVSVFITPSFFPDSPITFNGLDSLFINSSQVAELSPAQVQAMMAWLFQGGHLIVGIEELLEVQSLTWLRSILPIDLSSTKSISLESPPEDWIRTKDGKRYSSEYANDTNVIGKPFTISTGSLRDGKVIAAEQGIPLVIQAPRGRGKITVLAFSPERQPFSGWKNRPWFWAAITEVPASLFNSNDYRMKGGWTLDAFYGALIETKQVRRLPMGSLLIMLVGYLAVIGPLDRYWLAKRKKEIWTWITFPIYVICFSGLFYVVGFALRAGDSEYNEVHVIDLHPGGNESLWAGKTYGLIYSPVNRTYELRGHQKYSALRQERGSSWGGEIKPLDAMFQGNQSRAALRVPIWTSKMVVNDWYDNKPPVIRAAFRGNKVTITNELDLPITRVAVVSSNRIYFSTITPKGNQVIDLATNSFSSLSTWVKQSGNNYQNLAQQRHNAWRGPAGTAPELSTAAIAASFVRYVNRQETDWDTERFADEDLVPLMEAGYAIVLAWVDNHSFFPAMSDFSTKRQSRYTLLRMALLPSK